MRPLAALSMLLVLVAAPFGGAAALPWDDCGSGRDAPDFSSEPPLVVAFPVDCRGHLLATETADVYAFEAPAHDGRIDFVVERDPTLMARLCATAPGATRETCWTHAREAPLAASALAAPGLWRLRVAREGAGGGAYRLLATHAPLPAQDDCGSGRDAGTGAAHVAVAGLPLLCEGTFPQGGLDDADEYRFVVAGGDRLAVRLDLHHRNGWYCVQSPAGWRSCGSGYGDTVDTRTFLAPQPGTWGISVESRGLTGNYTVRAAIENQTPAPDDCASGADAAGLALALPATCDARLWPTFGDRMDAYVLDLAEPAALDLAITAGDPRLTLCLIDPAGALAACGGHGARGNAIRYGATTPGAWQVHVSMRDWWWGDDTPFPYTLTAAAGPYVPDPQDDCGSGADAADVRSGALPVTLPMDCEGAIPAVSPDAEDWYAFEATAGTSVEVVLTTLYGGDADLCLHDPHGAALRCVALAAAAPDRIRMPLETDGTHTLRVHRYAGAPAYRLEARLVPHDDCGLGRDAPRAPHDAPVVATPAACQGEFPRGEDDTLDHYAFHAEEGQAIAVTLAAMPFADYSLCLYAPNRAMPVSCGRTAWAPERVATVAWATGTWRVAVEATAGRGTYDLDIVVE